MTVSVTGRTRTRDSTGTSTWAWAGAAIGALAGGLACLPAAWLANAVAQGSGGQLVLAEARGTVWSGSAVAVLSGGADSRSAMALPGRLGWSLGWGNGALTLRLQHDCCLRGTPALRITPGLGRWQFALQPQEGSPVVGQWPAAWLSGLGTPWNTLQLEGDLRLSARMLQLERAQGRWRVVGEAAVELQRVASRVSTLPVLGSYRLQLTGGDAGAQLKLDTLGGALQLSGQGAWSAAGLRFRGEASAAPDARDALDNLLNIIGRRQGERSLIAIG